MRKSEDLSFLVKEYSSAVNGTNSDATIRQALVRDADWTENGAEALVHIAKRYGSFVLRNALALSIALGIEDGEAGL